MSGPVSLFYRDGVDNSAVNLKNDVNCDLPKLSKVVTPAALMMTMGVAASLALASTNAASTANSAGLKFNGDFDSANSLQGWSLILEGNAKAEIAADAVTVADATNSNALKFSVEDVGNRCGAMYRGGSEMKVQGERWYELRFRARTEGKRYGLVVSLENEDGTKVCGRATIPEVGGDWADYLLSVSTRHSSPSGRLVIAMFEPGTIWLDSVSLSARQTSE